MSRGTRSSDAAEVRLNVKLSRRDHPILTEELARQPKGPRRTNRLAHLATLGLVWERWASGCSEARHLLNVPGMATPTFPPGAAVQPYQSRLDGSQLAALLDDEPS
ncbi:MAG TPA: hypothetical protein VFP68_12875 [Burkholderiaceae bacterium]|nr:hypothetical protein [Burkholderiaceae bacterium]